jgi:hypothetical protein
MILDILTVLFFGLGFALLFWMIAEPGRDVLHGPYVTKEQHMEEEMENICTTRNGPPWRSQHYGRRRAVRGTAT